MKFIKQNLFWVIAAAVLLAEVVFAALPLRSKYSINASQRSQIESQKRELIALLADPKKLANDNVIKAARKYRDSIERNYLEMMLFLMERDFRLKRIEPPTRNPFILDRGELAARVESYNHLTDAVRERALAAGMNVSKDTAIIKANWGGNVPTPLEIIDAFKILWLQRVCVDAMMSADEKEKTLVRTINQFTFGKGTGSSLNVLPGDKDYNRLLFFLDVAMQLNNVPVFLSQVLRSDLIIDLRGMDIIKGQQQQQERKEGPGGAPVMVVKPEDTRLVQVIFAFEAIDFSVDATKVTFASNKFKTEAETQDWIRSAKLGTGISAELFQLFLLDRMKATKAVPGKEGFEYLLRSPEQVGQGKPQTIQIDEGVTVYITTMSQP
jgi:hypothetical protein